MGTFSIDCTVIQIVDRARATLVPQMLVDTGSECTWVPGDILEALGVEREKKDLAFSMANGEIITRSVGYAILQIGPYVTIDEVVFAQPGDLKILGARTLEGLNVKVDPREKKLVAAGPLPAATTAFPDTNDVASSTTR